MKEKVATVENGLYISVGNVTYKHTSGVVLFDESGQQKFADREEFGKWFKDLLEKNSKEYIDLRLKIIEARKLITIIQQKGKNKTIVEFMSNLEQVSSLFKQFTHGLGGDISLMTTFLFGKSGSETYFLANEDDLPSSLTEIGEKKYKNTLSTLQQLEKSGQNLKKLNSALKSHLNNFYAQTVQTSLLEKPDYIDMMIWSYYNIRSRFDAWKGKTANGKKGTRSHFPVSLANFFYGKTRNKHGFIAEAFGTHSVMLHQDIMFDSHVSKLQQSVINEHDGPGSPELFSLLASAKGRDMSQLGGDIIVVDGQGRVTYNIQSKASKSTNYSFTITYEKFLKQVMDFLDTYDKYQENKNSLTEQDIDYLYEKFSAHAWVSTVRKLNIEVDRLTMDKMLKDLKF